MRKNLKKLIVGSLLLLAAHFGLDVHTAAAACTNTFPVSYNNYVAGNCIPSAWANTLEQLIGLFNSTSSVNNIFTELRGTATSSILSNSSTITTLYYDRLGHTYPQTITATTTIAFAGTTSTGPSFNFASGTFINIATSSNNTFTWNFANPGFLTNASITAQAPIAWSGSNVISWTGLTTSSPLSIGQWLVATAANQIAGTSSPVLNVSAGSNITTTGPSATGTSVVSLVASPNVTGLTAANVTSTATFASQGTATFTATTTLASTTQLSSLSGIIAASSSNSGQLFAVTIGGGLQFTNGVLSSTISGGGSGSLTTSSPWSSSPQGIVYAVNGSSVSASSSAVITANGAVSSSQIYSASTTLTGIANALLGTDANGKIISTTTPVTAGSCTNCNLTIDGTGRVTSQANGSAGGGGSSSSTYNIEMPIGDWTLPSSSFPQFNQFVGANWVHDVLDFNSTTTNYAYFARTIPTNIGSIGSSTMYITWFSSATTGTGVWNLLTRCATSSVTIDATTNPAIVSATSTAVTTAGTANQWNMSTIQIPTSAWNMTSTAPMLSCQFKLTEPTNSSTIAQDINVTDITLQLIH